MLLDAADLRDFYKTPLGLVVRRALANRISDVWSGRQHGTIIGLGFASPFLGRYRSNATRIGALMPQSQGALIWPSHSLVRTVLVEEHQLPLPDNSVDWLLAVHCLEGSGRAEPLLREMWRVLAPDGRMLIVVPNRRGIWARTDTTPFGQGRPYSRSQLELLLKQALFTPTAWSSALHFPPLTNAMVLRSASAIERGGRRISDMLAGVILVEAKKELMIPSAVGKPVPRVLHDLVQARRESGAHSRHHPTLSPKP
jgi:SAM-dependent methyltransferase